MFTYFNIHKKMIHLNAIINALSLEYIVVFQVDALHLDIRTSYIMTVQSNNCCSSLFIRMICKAV